MHESIGCQRQKGEDKIAGLVDGRRWDIMKEIGSRTNQWRRDMTPEAATQREWLKQWIDAGPALAAHRREELRHLSDERALAATDALFSVATTVSAKRLGWSGLVEQQAIFHRRPSP